MTNPTNKEERLTVAEYDREYLRILDQIHAFARATGAPAGADVINWFRSVGVGIHATRTTPESPHNPGQGDGHG